VYFAQSKFLYLFAHQSEEILLVTMVVGCVVIAELFITEVQ
jgi:hypothetical protein